jgi:hypothetical protein
MDTLLNFMAIGAPSPSMPNIGPWGHFIWVCVILVCIFFVLWFIWTKVCGLIPEPYRTVLMVLGIVAIGSRVYLWGFSPANGGVLICLS